MRPLDSDNVVPQKFFDLIMRRDGIVWLRRNAVLYPSTDDVHRAYDTFLKVVDDWLLGRRIKSGALGTKERTPMGWLYDLRNATGLRNDPEFEKVIQARRPDLLKRSPLLAILVRTAAGRMQVTRLTRDNKSDLQVFVDFDEAVSWLTERLDAT